MAVPATAARDARPALRTAGVSTLAAAALAACGGGGDEPDDFDYGPADPTAGKIAAAEAARFLHQAQFSAGDSEINAVQTKGYSRWLREQMNKTSTTGWDWLMDQGYNRLDVRYTQSYADNMVWNQLVAASDAVRKRVALAWSEIMVVSTSSVDSDTPSFAMAAYWDVLNRNAFGSYRKLLEEITLNPAMGFFLNTRGNQKADSKTGRVPDENYAREVMQLFSIGLYDLNIDGTLQDGKATESYTQDDVANLARIFTGYNLDKKNGHQDAVNPVAYRNPMVLNEQLHSPEDATFLGSTVAGGSGAVRLGKALDIIAGHPNVGPFIGRQLIQRLVTSDPSPAYVGRVAAVFNDDGAGVRGNLRAVTEAVLVDPEARQDVRLTAPTWGKLREPMLRFVQWARTFSATASDNRAGIGNLAGNLGQSPLRSPSVFNFFRPGYVPAGTSLTQPAPEFQITNENTVASYINFMNGVVKSGYTGYPGGDPYKLTSSYSRELALVDDPAKLVARLNLLLTGDQLSDATVAAITGAIATIGVDSTDAKKKEAGRNNRVWAAVLLVMSCPDYLVQK